MTLPKDELFQDCLQEVRKVDLLLPACACCLERVRKDDIDPPTLEEATAAVEQRVGGDAIPEDDPTIEEELAIAALLMWAFLQHWHNQQAYGVLSAAAKSRSLPRMQQAINQVSVLLSTSSAHNNVQSTMQGILKKGLSLGILFGTKGQGAGTNLSGTVNYLDRMNDAVSYYLNQYFPRVVQPALLGQIQAAVSAAGNEDYLAILDDIIANRVAGSSAYWRMVANVNASRSYSYGVLRGAQSVGFRGYRLVAIRDPRTTPLCRSLDGREFYIANAVALMDHAANAGPAMIANIMPWLPTKTDASALSASELEGMGVLVPPFHANCRTTLLPIHV